MSGGMLCVCWRTLLLMLMLNRRGQFTQISKLYGAEHWARMSKQRKLTVGVERKCCSSIIIIIIINVIIYYLLILLFT